jgi:penicillin amidase
MADALTAVIQRLRVAHGDDASAWALGRLRPLRLEHPVGKVPQLALIFNRGPFPWGGDGATVSQAGLTPFKPLANPGAIASVRVVIDVGAWDEARFCLPGGQSGNPLSPHYDDQLALWLNGEGVPIAWSPLEVGLATRHTLRLRPLGE